ncbi:MULTISPECIES: hypothetical protein [unclassified Anabaena]|uniref:hypothetical protein n=1 Tax=unclassified Anabaena TaxID=2619674 RepID=UPI00144860B6|nr:MULTISPECIES: hypothetical protein [unclassified Anabaena]MTJ09289.1 hypothetical protein [Anabaena sp. UHCC 0204]MTJ52389.1 hypothetical protein [Anabaena sp. UHCC 0253]
MKNSIANLNTLHLVPSLADLELLEALLEPEDGTYPWNVSDAASEAYFHHLEQQFDLQNFSEGELNTSADNFYQNLDIIWDQFPAIEEDNLRENTVHYLQKALQNAFLVIPEVLLTAICSKASEVLILEQSASEKLVECVQALLPSWEIDDLLVLARPFAYAMRSSEQHTLTTVIGDGEQSCGHLRDWENLSAIEQAKISLAIADYALKYLSKCDSQT